MSFRAFIALDLSPEALAAVEAEQVPLRAAITRQGVRFVRPDKIHLTLLFLGQLDEERLPELADALQQGISGLKPPRLRVGGIGAFPTIQRPKTIWLGVEEEGLGELQSAVATAAKPFAELRDDKPYRPHLTLARVSPGSKAVGFLIQPLVARLPAGTEWCPSEVVVYESTPGGDYLERSRVTIPV